MYITFISYTYCLTITMGEGFMLVDEYERLEVFTLYI
jgi:hypothetical protein